MGARGPSAAAGPRTYDQWKVGNAGGSVNCDAILYIRNQCMSACTRCVTKVHEMDARARATFMHTCTGTGRIDFNFKL